jgi:hypothetical protein
MPLLNKLPKDLPKGQLVKRWHMLQKELTKSPIPLRVSLEIHQVEHELIRRC